MGHILISDLVGTGSWCEKGHLEDTEGESIFNQISWIIKVVISVQQFLPRLILGFLDSLSSMDLHISSCLRFVGLERVEARDYQEQNLVFSSPSHIQFVSEGNDCQVCAGRSCASLAPNSFDGGQRDRPPGMMTRYHVCQQQRRL